MFRNELEFRAWWATLPLETQYAIIKRCELILQPAVEAITEMIRAYMQAVEDITQTASVFLQELSELPWPELEQMAVDAQEYVDKRAAERKRWGHPPKSLHTSYSQPMKKIRPSARSRIRQRSGRRRA